MVCVSDVSVDREDNLVKELWRFQAELAAGLEDQTLADGP